MYMHVVAVWVPRVPKGTQTVFKNLKFQNRTARNVWSAVGVLDFCSRMSGSSTRLLAGECSVAVLCLGFQAGLAGECSVADLCLGFQAGRLGASSASELELGGEQFAPRESSVGVLCKAREPTLCSMADSGPNLMQSTYDEPKYT